MGHWGTLIYESDAALDYKGTITDLLERELAYLFSVEEANNSGWWLARVFGVIEIMLCFEKRDVEQNYLNSLMCVRDPNRVRRWRELFLKIWDGDWDINPKNTTYQIYLYDNPEYRRQHRSVVIKMFDYLESIAVFLDSSLTNVDRPVWTFAPSELPYFSIRHWKYQGNNERIWVDRFTYDLIEYLMKDIVYFLSPEKRASGTLNVEEVWVAVDILGTLCEVYQQPPGFNQPVIQTWRESTTQMWMLLLGGESHPMYPDVLRAFDRLEAVALKYPTIEW